MATEEEGDRVGGLHQSWNNYRRTAIVDRGTSPEHLYVRMYYKHVGTAVDYCRLPTIALAGRRAIDDSENDDDDGDDGDDDGLPPTVGQNGQQVGQNLAGSKVVWCL